MDGHGSQPGNEKRKPKLENQLSSRAISTESRRCGRPGLS